MKNIKGTFILLLTAFIWGTAFVAQTSAGDSIGVFTFNALRNIIAAVFLFIYISIKNIIPSNTKSNSQKQVLKSDTKWPVKEGIICGVILCAAMNVQQAGINIYPDGAAVSGRAGFLTATYVVMVSLAAIFSGQKLHKLVISAAIVCMIGMYLLCMGNGFGGFYFADVLELICAFIFTLHILTVDRFQYADGVKLSCIQFLTAGIISFILMLIFETININDIVNAALPILYAGIFSSGIAYTLQIIGQKYAKPSVTSIVLSLESVFAALAGWILLNEMLSPREILGCVLVFAAVIMAQIPNMIKP